MALSASMASLAAAQTCLRLSNVRRECRLPPRRAGASKRGSGSSSAPKERPAGRRGQRPPGRDWGAA
eukprot:5038073-Alexandrium_andersonii.AAC.1